MDRYRFQIEVYHPHYPTDTEHVRTAVTAPDPVTAHRIVLERAW